MNHVAVGRPRIRSAGLPGWMMAVGRAGSLPSPSAPGIRRNGDTEMVVSREQEPQPVQAQQFHCSSTIFKQIHGYVIAHLSKIQAKQRQHHEIRAKRRESAKNNQNTITGVENCNNKVLAGMV